MESLGSRTRGFLSVSTPPFACNVVADRAWHAGPAYRDIKALFKQARASLVPK